MFLIILDAAMVNLAGRAIREGLELTATELTVVASSYLVAFAGLLLLGGRLADVLGGRRVFLAGMAVYLAASAFCALAVSGPMLIAGRIGQGAGAAIVVPSALALALALHRSPAERARVVGIWGAVAGGGSLLGVSLGGTLTQVWDWQSVFWAPVPFGIVSALIVLRSVPALRGRSGRFDALGAITITSGICAVAFGMVYAAESRWSEPGAFIAIAAGLAFLVAFVIAEHRSTHPLVPLVVFRRGPVVRASVIVVLLGATLSSMFFFLPLYEQEVLGMDALTSGLAQIPLALMIIVGSATAPLVARAIGLSRALSAGLALLLAGFLWLTLNPATDGFVHLMGAFVLIGGGFSLGLVNAIAMAVRDSGEGESGLLSGLVNAAQQVGGAVGLATLADIAIGAAGTQGEIEFSTAFVSEAALILVALALSLIPADRTKRGSAT
ncbi:DHA2 family efflux MFS transporter permease subunit [Pseudonocardia yunnanensis]